MGDGEVSGGACCASCAAGKPCEGYCPPREAGAGCGCSGGDHAHDEAPREAGAAEALADRHPIVARARGVTGSHARVELPRASGDGDDDRDAFLRSIRGLRENERAAALREYMQRRGASEDATNTALLALAQRGLDGVSNYFSRDFERQMLAIREGNSTERERLRQEGETARIELCYRYGGAACGAVGPSQQQAQAQTQQQFAQRDQDRSDTMLIGLGLLAVVAVGYALTNGKRGG